MKHFFVGIKAIIRDGDKVLLAKGPAGGDRDFWDCPGGRIDDNETIRQALDRELSEEVPSLQSYQVGRLVHAERVHKDVKDDISLVLVFYEVTDPVFDGPLRVSEEHEQLAWFELAEARRIGKYSIAAALDQIDLV